MTAFDLPKSAEVCGVEYEINADYRDILEIISYINDPDLTDEEKTLISLALFYEDFTPTPENIGAAVEYLQSFIACFRPEPSGHSPQLIDWKQDAQLIFAEVNKVCGKEVRAEGYMHWFTFVGYFMCVGEGQLSAIVSIRDKRIRGKKLEKWEKDYFAENRSAIILKKPLTRAEREPDERISQYPCFGK